LGGGELLGARFFLNLFCREWDLDWDLDWDAGGLPGVSKLNSSFGGEAPVFERLGFDCGFDWGAARATVRAESSDAWEV